MRNKTSFIYFREVKYSLSVAVYDKVKFLDLRAALPFLGALDYIFWDGNIGFCSSCKKVPTKSDLLFALYLVNPKKKILPMCKKKSFFCRNELHLVRGFQKGITLGVKKAGTRPWPHPPPQNMTPGPKCYTFLESSHQMQLIFAEKRFFLQIGRIFFFGFTK